MPDNRVAPVRRSNFSFLNPFLRLNRNDAGLATQAGSPAPLNVREIRAFRGSAADTQPRSPPAFAEIVSADFPILQGCQLVRNHRASHSVADGDMANRTGTFIRL